jgi:hypothetical protein
MLMSSIFISCGDDNDEALPEKIPVNITKEYSYTYVIKGFSGDDASHKDTIYLADIIGEFAAAKLTGADFQIADSYIIITGLKAMDTNPVLADFSLQSGNNTPVFLGNCTAYAQFPTDFKSEIRQSTQKVSDFIKSVFLAYTTSKKKEAAIKIAYKPTKDILPSDGVKLTIVITGTYNYYTYK